MTRDVELEHAAGLDGVTEPHGREVFRPAPATTLGQHNRSRPDVPVEMADQRGVAPRREDARRVP